MDAYKWEHEQSELFKNIESLTYHLLQMKLEFENYKKSTMKTCKKCDFGDGKENQFNRNENKFQKTLKENQNSKILESNQSRDNEELFEQSIDLSNRPSVKATLNFDHDHSDLLMRQALIRDFGRYHGNGLSSLERERRKARYFGKYLQMRKHKPYFGMLY